MTAWAEGALRSPVSSAVLVQDSPQSLAAPGERWPVIEGIPFLRADRRMLAEEALAALDRGDPDAALILLLGDQDGWARTPPPLEADRRHVVREAASMPFRDAMDLLAFGPVGAYFAHRWSDPTFLSGLGLAEAHWAEGSTFELACGAGHFLREFGRRMTAPANVAGGDIVFAKLWLARRWVAPQARLVCFDAARPWPVAGFDTVFCHDAFYFLPDKPAVVAEMHRVAPRLLVGHAHNGLVDNLSAGEPMSPEGYAALFEGALLYDDQELTAALVESRAPVPADPSALHAAPAISLAWGAGAPKPVLAGLAMPQAGAALRRNPIYAGSGIAWPSERYAREYGPLVTYPPVPEGPETAVAGADPIIDALARRRVLLDLPASW